MRSNVFSESPIMKMIIKMKIKNKEIYTFLINIAKFQTLWLKAALYYLFLYKISYTKIYAILSQKDVKFFERKVIHVSEFYQTIDDVMHMRNDNHPYKYKGDSEFNRYRVKKVSQKL